MKAGGLLELYGAFPRRLQAIERAGCGREKSKRIVVGAAHWQQIHKCRDFARCKTQRLRWVANLSGLINHGPLVKTMATEERSAVLRAREKVAQPFHKLPPLVLQRFGSDAPLRDAVARNAKVALRFIAAQGDALSRMPSPQERWAVGIILEKKVIDRMFYPRRCTLQSGCDPRLNPLLMRRAQGYPLRWREGFHKPRDW